MKQIFNVPHPLDVPTFEYKDYPIGGKMVIGRFRYEDDLRMLNPDEKDVLRHDVVKQMVEEIIAKKLCDMTQMRDPLSYNTIITVRAYLAQDSDVRLLRTLYKD